MSDYVEVLGVDELNNLSLEELDKIEDKVYNYWNKIRVVQKFMQECEKE